jgi:hypothetical protein
VQAVQANTFAERALCRRSTCIFDLRPAALSSTSVIHIACFDEQENTPAPSVVSLASTILIVEVGNGGLMPPCPKVGNGRESPTTLVACKKNAP